MIKTMFSVWWCRLLTRSSVAMQMLGRGKVNYSPLIPRLIYRKHGRPPCGLPAVTARGGHRPAEHQPDKKVGGKIESSRCR